ncbi:MAG: hypothetical protein IKA36_03930, partial [Clostridia bacterium]|nr:hypothetical protein [Clostridia bacterium]
ILPMLGGLLGKSFDLNSVASILNSKQNNSFTDGNMLGNIMKILSSDVGKNILGILGKNNKKNNQKNQKNIQKIKSTEICIDNYERVE